jgi:hypothetical protein
MYKKTVIAFLMISGSLIQAFGQSASACYNKDMAGFIKDGQDYTLTLEDSRTGKIYLSFFEGFQYRLVICSNNTKKFKILIFDIEKNLLFSTICDDYNKKIDLKFKSNIACIAEVSVDKMPKVAPVFTIAIGFKEDQADK